MTMKKWLGMLLALMLLPGAGALAQDEGAVVQSSCSIVEVGEYHLVYCFAQVHNNAAQTICLDEGNLHLMNGEETLASQEVSGLWPMYIKPGEDGYLFDVVYLERGEAAPSITGIQYDVGYMTLEAPMDGQKLETQARVEVSDESGRMYVVCEMTNPTAEDAFNPTLGLGLYTEGGQMLYADGVRLKDIGIPAGGRVKVRFDVETEVAEQWRSYGVTPAMAAANAVFSTVED